MEWIKKRGWGRAGAGLLPAKEDQPTLLLEYFGALSTCKICASEWAADALAAWGGVQACY